MNLSCLIIDDEPNAVALLELLIQQSTEWTILDKCYNGLEALERLKTATPAVVFLDINMPLLSGMELAGLLPADTAIVFTTAYAQYAAESYNYPTIDYLLKPITLKRFLGAVQKIEALFRKKEKDVSTLSRAEADYFFVKSGKAMRKISPDDILYIEGEKEYARLVTTTEQILVYRRLKDIEAQALPFFVRVHNSYIVNTKQINKIEDNHIFIKSKKIPVSEKFKEAFMEMINKRKF